MIRNSSGLARVHDDRATKLVLSTLNHVLESIDPALLVARSVKLGNKLIVTGIDGTKVGISDFEDVYVVGAGKASARMADSLCSILGQRVIGGAITVPYGQDVKLNKRSASISVTKASHPVPDLSGVRGTKSIISVLSRATKNDLVIVLISGGGSALMPLPSGNVTLSDKRAVTNKLLTSGATIAEINVVRKHLSAIKGGQLLRYADRARVLSLILSDVVGDDISAIASGPTYPDTSTFAQALRIARHYGAIERKSRVEDHLIAGTKGSIRETPKPGDSLFSKVHNMVIGNNATACHAATAFLRRHSIKAEYLGSRFDGKAVDYGLFLARLASDFRANGATNFGLVLGGETVVQLGKVKGKGGRNQEAGLSCSRLIEDGIVIAFMGTDGIDGNTSAAGSLISSMTSRMAKGRRISPERYLERHDSYTALKALRSLIFTGSTGTNVNDVAIVCAKS